MPNTRQLQLPSGRVVRVCVECAREVPQHAYYCAAVRAYSRSQVMREMVRVEDELRQIEPLIVDPAPNAFVVSERFLLRSEFWEWAWWIGLDFWESTEDARAAIRAEVSETRQQLTRQRSEDAAA